MTITFSKVVASTGLGGPGLNPAGAEEEIGAVAWSGPLDCE